MSYIPEASTSNGVTITYSIPAPPDVQLNFGTTTEKRIQFLNGYLCSGGLDSGSKDMNVDGSVTPQTFYVAAALDYDIVITHCILTVIDKMLPMNRFGALTPLTNGIDINIHESTNDTLLINKAKTNGDILVQSGILLPFGINGDLNEITSFDGTNDALVVTFPFINIIPGGFRISKDTLDKIQFIVNDDLSTLTGMTMKVYGYKEFY